MYFEKLHYNNNKSYFYEHKNEYDTYVYQPLLQLYYDLIPVINDIDSELCTKQGRCLSTPYTDARFNREHLLKEYIYMRFKVLRTRKNDFPGFFMDASKDSIRYGLKIYNLTSEGMQKVKRYFQENMDFSNDIIHRFNQQSEVSLIGTDYKKDHYPEVETELNGWLNKKDWLFIHSEPISDCFLIRELYEKIKNTYLSLENLYLAIKTALDNEDFNTNRFFYY